jgi:hypothetical protein
MDTKIHSVTFEQKDATFKDFLKAAFAYATGRPARARAILRGEQHLIGKNADGQLVIGISGGASMTVFANDGKEPARGVIEPPRPSNGGFKL